MYYCFKVTIVKPYGSIERYIESCFLTGANGARRAYEHMTRLYEFKRNNNIIKAFNLSLITSNSTK